MNKVYISVILIVISVLLATNANAIDMQKTKSGAYIFPLMPKSLYKVIDSFNCPKNWILFYLEDPDDSATVSCHPASEIKMTCASAPARVIIKNSGAAIPVGNISQCVATADIGPRPAELWFIHNKEGSKFRYQVKYKIKVDKNGKDTSIEKMKDVLDGIKKENEEVKEEEEKDYEVIYE